MHAAARKNVLVTEGLLVLMSVIWGMNFAVMKYGTDVLEPLAYNGVRLAVGSVVMLVILVVPPYAGAAVARHPRADAARSLGTGLYQAFFINGLAMTRAGTASLVVAASPAVIAIVGRIMGVERVNLRAVWGIVLSIAGIAFVIVSSASSSEGHSSVFGLLLILASVVCWSFYTHLMRPLHASHRRHPDRDVVAHRRDDTGTRHRRFRRSCARTGRRSCRSPGARSCYSGIGSMGIAYLFWYRGVRVIGSTRTAMFSNLQPIVALAVSWPLLGETPTLMQGVGAGAVLGGLLLTRQPSAPEPAHGE